MVRGRDGKQGLIIDFTESVQSGGDTYQRATSLSANVSATFGSISLGRHKTLFDAVCQ